MDTNALPEEVAGLRREMTRMNRHRYMQLHNSIPRPILSRLCRGRALGPGRAPGASLLPSILVRSLGRINLTPVIGLRATGILETIVPSTPDQAAPGRTGPPAPENPMRPAFVLSLCLALVATPLAAQQPDLAGWLPAFRDRALAAGIRAMTFDTAMADIAAQPDTLRRDRNQAEFSRTIWAYLESAVSEARVRDGRAAMERHGTTIARIEAQYGVPAEVVAAIWGLESSYGSFRGDVPTLSALATLAADGRRSAFFEEQLVEALRILEAGDTTIATMRGSWAGAMGHTQFLPTSFRDHAVDFDGDGRRDLWGDDPTDALASTAAYLAANGWRTGEPWTVEVTLPEEFDYLLTGERVEKPVADWAARGVRAADGAALPAGAAASIRVPGGHAGAAFLSYPNFRAIESYNTADAYVIAVGHLADRLAGGGPLRGGWPEGDRAPDLAERLEMQERLRAAGFDPLRVDGKVGPDTMDAIQRWQAANGLVPDGYASPALLERLRRQDVAPTVGSMDPARDASRADEDGTAAETGG